MVDSGECRFFLQKKVHEGEFDVCNKFEKKCLDFCNMVSSAVTQFLVFCCEHQLNGTKLGL